MTITDAIKVFITLLTMAFIGTGVYTVLHLHPDSLAASIIRVIVVLAFISLAIAIATRLDRQNVMQPKR